MDNRGFTYTEILITLAVMAALFVPMMQLFSFGITSSAITGEKITALNLAKWQMERTKNLNYTTDQFKQIGSSYFPDLKDAPLELNKKKWRIFTEIGDSEPLSVKISVYYEDRTGDKPLVELATLLQDMTWFKENK